MGFLGNQIEKQIRKNEDFGFKVKAVCDYVRDNAKEIIEQAKEAQTIGGGYMVSSTIVCGEYQTEKEVAQIVKKIPGRDSKGAYVETDYGRVYVQYNLGSFVFYYLDGTASSKSFNDKYDNDEEDENEDAEEEEDDRKNQAKVTKIENMPMPTNSKDAIMAIKECTLKAKHADSYDIRKAWEERQEMIEEYSKIHYMDDSAVTAYFEESERKKKEAEEKERQEKEQEEKEKAEQKMRLKKSARIFWSIYAVLTIFLFWWAEAWITYVLVVILLAVIAAIRGFYYMMKS